MDRRDFIKAEGSTLVVTSGRSRKPVNMSLRALCAVLLAANGFAADAASNITFTLSGTAFRLADGGVSSRSNMMRLDGGTAVSAPFAIDRDWLCFDIDINSFSPKTGVGLTADGREEFRVSGMIAGGRGTWAFDLRTLRGRTGVLTVGDAGSWDIVSVTNISFASEPPPGARRLTPQSSNRPFERTFDVRGGESIAVPYDRDGPSARLVVSADGRDAFDFKIRLAREGRGERIGYIPLGELKGRVTVRSDRAILPAASADEVLSQVRLVREPPGRADRPRLHFVPAFGQSGDMIGFFRTGADFHIGFLTDPIGADWGENCFWGHAVGTNLFDWTELAHSDRKGLGVKRSSGCCFVDERNRSGLGAGGRSPVLLFGFVEHDDGQCGQVFGTTKAADPNPGKLPELRLKYSTDGGRTFVPYAGKPLIRTRFCGGHDPEVVYSPADDRFVMAMHDRRDGAWGFDLYVSDNLLDWTYASTVPGLWETPNLFPLELEGETHWILQECLGGYLVGKLEGGRFLPDAFGKRAPQYAKIYAPRTLRTADGRRIWMAALQCGLEGGGATLPLELSLRRVDGKPTLAFAPARELGGLVRETRSGTSTEELNRVCAEFGDSPFDLTVELSDGAAFEVMAGGEAAFTRPADGARRLRLVFDAPLLDWFAGDGISAGTKRVDGLRKPGGLRFSASGGLSYRLQVLKKRH